MRCDSAPCCTGVISDPGYGVSESTAKYNQTLLVWESKAAKMFVKCPRSDLMWEYSREASGKFTASVFRMFPTPDRHETEKEKRPQEETEVPEETDECQLGKITRCESFQGRGLDFYSGTHTSCPASWKLQLGANPHRDARDIVPVNVVWSGQSPAALFTGQRQTPECQYPVLWDTGWLVGGD